MSASSPCPPHLGVLRSRGLSRTWEVLSRCYLSPATPFAPRPRPGPLPRAHACTFCLQFFIVLLITLLAELILIILFFVYTDKVSLPGGEGAYGTSLPLGLGLGSRRKSSDSSYL